MGHKLRSQDDGHDTTGDTLKRQTSPASEVLPFIAGASTIGLLSRKDAGVNATPI